MARRKSKPAKGKRSERARSSTRAIWKGSINFGLVNIPVGLYTAESSANLDFDLLDRRDFSPVHYRRVNAKTGREVPWDQIVKGYQYKKGEYVALSDQDFVNANVKATQSIDIVAFVDAAEISPIYFDKPYYLEPLKAGRRAYALLREVMKKTGKVAVAKVVIRTRQHLAALIVQGPLLVLNLLRFPEELRYAAALDLPEEGSERGEFSPQEVKMAQQLVETMSDKWNPKTYRDEYREDLLKLIDKKVKSGQTKVVEKAGPEPQPERRGNVIDIMHLLRQSVNQAHKKEEPARRRRKAS
jgi:DNA end-binding protein Ku